MITYETQAIDSIVAGGKLQADIDNFPKVGDTVEIGFSFWGKTSPYKVLRIAKYENAKSCIRDANGNERLISLAELKLGKRI